MYDFGTESRYTQHVRMLSALTPGHLSSKQLQDQLHDLNTYSISEGPSIYCFDNRALFETDGYRAEILHNIDHILEKYAGDFTSPGSTQSVKIEKDLLWASLQLYAHLQAIEQDVGLILEPKTGYMQSLKKLETCHGLLQKNGSNIEELETLLKHKPIVSDPIAGRWYEEAFKSFIQYIDDRNNTRLFWVWGRPNLDLALGALGETIAQERLSQTTYWPGQVSWSLYLFRGSLFALKMFNVWWNDPKWLKNLEGLSAEEYADYRMRHLLAYWNIYKYRILNDYVWGPINWICFEWWTGEGWYEWLGNFATCFLLCMDIYLADLIYKEEEDKYLKVLGQYTKRFNELKDHLVTQIENDFKKELLRINPELVELEPLEQIDRLRDYLANKHRNRLGLQQDEIMLANYLIDLDDVYTRQTEHILTWSRKEKFLKLDCIYTKALLVAFAMCAALLIGGVLPLALKVFLINSGTILCLALTILYRTVRVGMQISQMHEERTRLQEKERVLFKEFNDLKVLRTKEFGLLHDGDPSSQAIQNDVNAVTQYDKRMHDIQLHLVIIGAKINYQTDSITYEWLELARTTLMRFSIPTLLGLTLVYAPATLFMLPAYVYTLAFAALFAFVLDKLAKRYKPGEVQTDSLFDAGKYQTFFHAPKVYSKAVENTVFCLPTLSFA